MSSIDERVVRMEFDNKQFESGVSTTMTTLEKFKEALKFRNEAAGFDDIQRASSAVNFSPLNDRLWQVQQNFSFFGEFIETVFTRISNKIIDVGSLMVRELTTNPLRAGFGEYELQMGSTQTIMASTGASIEDVTRYLDELNTYADKTIYSFSDMTANIGKFTNAGVPLEQAVAAIQGISNEAAVSGANAQEASRAMYNFAQALSAGYVKLIDWKSIENANMATVEFKQQLLDTAVELGTVERTADGMYRVLGTNANGATMRDTISATKNFNDSLSYQWMTSDVLTTTLAKYADETTEIGRKAFAAATEVKTFSQLIDTVKESLGSGWTKSFTYIFGNLEEAKVLWTGVNNEINAMLDPIAEAREEMLKFWHDNGGRAAAIQAISDAWQGLKTIMGAVSAAFKTIFPPMTGERLVEITKSIGDMAAKFKEFATSSVFLTDLRNIFQGFFSVVHRLLSVFASLASSLSPLLDIFYDFGSSIFEAVYWLSIFAGGVANADDPLKQFFMTTNSLEQVIYNVVFGVENLVKALLDFVGIHIEGNPITDIFDKLIEFASAHLDFSFINTLAAAGNKAVLAFGALGNALSGALNSLLGGLGAALQSVINLFTRFSNGADRTAEATKKVGDSFNVFGASKTVLGGFVLVMTTVGKKIGDFATSIGEGLPKIFEFLGSQELRNIITNFNSLMGGGLLLSLRNFIETLNKGKEEKKSGLFDGLKEMFSGVTDKAAETFEKLGEALSSLQDSLRADTLLKIAVAIGVIAASISVLASIDPDSMANGIMGIASAMGILVGAVTLLQNGGGSLKPHTMSVLASSLIKMAIAVGVLSLAVKLLASLDMDSLARGLVGVGAILGMLVTTSILLSRFSGKIKQAVKGLISFSIAIGIMSLSVRLLANLNSDQLTSGLIGVVSLMAAAVVASIAMSRLSGSEKSAKSMIKFALSIGILALTMKMLSGLNMDELERGLIGIGALMTGVVVAAIAMSKLSGVENSAKSMVVLAASIGILALVTKSLANMNMDELERGLIGVGTLVLAVSAFAAAVGKSSLTAGAAVSIVVLVAAIGMLSDVVKSLGGMSWQELAVGLVGVGASVAIMVGALLLLQNGAAGMLVGAAALTVLAIALRIFVPVLQTLAGMDTGSLIKGFLALGAALVAMGVASVAISALAPAIFVAAGAIAAFGLACGVLGAGIAIASAGLLAFVGAVTAGATAIVTGAGVIGVAIVSLVTSIVVAVVQGLVTGIVTILNSIGQILEALGNAIHAIGDFLIGNVPYVLSVVSTLVISVLSLLPTFIPQLVGVIVQFVVALLQTIITWLPVIAQTLVSGVVTLLNSVANGIRDNGESILAAVRNILSSIIELVLTALADIVRMIPGVGDTLAGYIEDGKETVRSTLAPESFGSMAGDAMDSAVKGVEKGGADLSAVAADAGEKTHEEFADALGDSDGIAEEFMKPLMEGMTGYDSDFADIANIDAESFLNSFESAGSGAGDSSDEMMQSILDGLHGHDGEFADMGASGVNSYISGFSSASTSAITSNPAEKALMAIESKQSSFSTAGTNSAKAFSDSVGKGSARSQGASLASSGASGAGSKKGSFTSAGGDVASGFNYGVASPNALSLARQAGARLGKSALDGVKGAIRSGSPSKESMKLGKYTTQGFAIGISSLTRSVYNEGSDIGRQALEGINESLGKMSKYLDEDIDFDPTIRPVMDLSEIQNGVAQMNQLVNNGVSTPLIGVGMGDYAQRMMASMTSAASNGAFGSVNGTVNEITYNINLNYAAGADANQMARDIMREVKRVQLTKGG